MEIKTLLISDPEYPQRLREIPDPPEELFYAGNLEILQQRILAIVGTRRCTAYGESHSESFAKELSQAGVCIVSGLAFGVDAAAHRGALEGCGKTVAVLAQGLPQISPAKHRHLAKRIVQEGGLLLSEKSKGEPNFKSDYLVRNRLISGLSEGVLVVEASHRSGALNTANHALEQNREILALPGRTTDESSAGTNRLIQNGAALVNRAEDVARWMGLSLKRSGPVKLEGVQQQVFDLLKAEAKSPAELAETFKGSLVELYAALSDLEIRGLIQNKASRYVVLSS